MVIPIPIASIPPDSRKYNLTAMTIPFKTYSKSTIKTMEQRVLVSNVVSVFYELWSSIFISHFDRVFF